MNRLRCCAVLPAPTPGASARAMNRLRCCAVLLALAGCERVVWLGRVPDRGDDLGGVHPGGPDSGPADLRGLGPRLSQRAAYDAADPGDLAAAELDGDGRPDLVVSRRGAGDVLLLLGQGDGTFRAADPLPVGPAAAALALADLDGDGALDLAVATDQGVLTLASRGPARFVAGARHPVEPAVALAAGDLDGDGRPDLVAACPGASQLQVLLSAGGPLTAAAAAPLRVALPAPPGAVALADLDGDGRRDVVAAAGGSLYLLRNRGAAGDPFAAPLAYPVDAELSSVRPADLDGDGRIDVAASAPGGVVYVLRNEGGLVLQNEKLRTRYGVGPGARGLVLADLDGGGRGDLVTANTAADSVSVLLGQGGGAFQQPARGFSVERAPVALAAADLDADGRGDLAVACRGSGRVVILLSSP